MALMNVRTYEEGKAKLKELGYQRCEPQHIKFPTATCACWHKPGSDAHFCLSKKGARIELELVNG